MSALRAGAGAALFCLLLAPWAATAEDQPAQNPRLEQSRAAVRAFGASLKTELTSALESGGPVGAIEVCRERAPALAAEASAALGARVGRTSLKVRNPANAPSDWQGAALEGFERRVAAGETAEALEFAADTADGGHRYMKAIAVAPLCLSCHGGQLAQPIEEAIDAAYPGDAARGYAAGDLRGAFYVEFPGNGASGERGMGSGQ